MEAVTQCLHNIFTPGIKMRFGRLDYKWTRETHSRLHLVFLIRLFVDLRVKTQAGEMTRDGEMTRLNYAQPCTYITLYEITAACVVR